MRFALIAFFPIAALFACGQQEEEDAPSPSQDAPQASLSSERKEQIRRFWELYRRATDLRVKGKWEESIPAYQQALEVDPRHEDGLYYLGNALFEVGRYAEAVESWSRLLKVNSRSSRAFVQLGTLYSCGAPGAPFDLDRAEREFDQALALNKEESGPVLKLGEIALLKGEKEKAFEYLNAAGRSNFRSTAAHYLSGYLSWKKGDHPAAQKALQQAVEQSHGGKTSVSASSEGDTRKGKALLASGSHPKSLLAPYWNALEQWSAESVSLARMEEEYRRLDRMLQKLWKESKTSTYYEWE